MCERTFIPRFLILGVLLLSGCPAELRELCERVPQEGWGRSPASLERLGPENASYWLEFAENRLKRTQSFLRPVRTLAQATEVRALLHTQANDWVYFLSQVERGRFQEAQSTLSQAREREERLGSLLCPKS